jgi:FkbM family methyltransferase
MADVNMEMINAMPEDAVILDIGANHGRYTVEMGKMRNRKVYAFEPEPKNLVKLRAAIAKSECKDYDNIEVHALALSNKVGIAKLMIQPSNPGGHSIAPALDGMKWKHKLSNSVDVAAITLDKWIEENNITRLDGIKVDVEAHEVEVIEGAQETLKKFHPLIALETHQTVDLEKLREILRGCGYTVGALQQDKGFLFRA